MKKLRVLMVTLCVAVFLCGFSVTAYAGGQCGTGDLTTNAPDGHPTRPRGYGAGANAKLISLDEALSITSHDVLKKAAGILLYH